MIQDLTDANSSYEAMSYNGRTITDSKTKAKFSFYHYVKVSQLLASKKNCDINVIIKKNVDSLSCDDERCFPMEVGEVLSVIDCQSR